MRVNYAKGLWGDKAHRRSRARCALQGCPHHVHLLNAVADHKGLRPAGTTAPRQDAPTSTVLTGYQGSGTEILSTAPGRAGQSGV